MRILVVGAGIAGLVTALRAAARGYAVDLLVKGTLGDGCTPLAQGGIAGAYGEGDSPALHALDTAQAAAGHGDAEAIAALVDGAPAAIDALTDAGVAFDRAADGTLARGLEAAHSRARIAHAGGDATGAAISRALVERIRQSRVQVRERTVATDLIVRDGQVRGVRLLDGGAVLADAVVLATGGAGQLYAHTTNALGACGDGIAMALTAGAQVADLEFVQFHPTVLADTDPFLISEAVRGAGAVLRDADGERFLAGEHPDAELAPRDVVARAVARRAHEQGTPVLLDATALGATTLARRFPTIDAALRRRGMDWAQAPIPVTPAAHYLMGGVATDVDGRTSLPGLWAVGETACTGVHGANRLASNSLLEGAVFAARAVDALYHPWPDSPRLRGAVATDLVPDPAPAPVPAFSRSALQQVMWDQVGLLREPSGLRTASTILAAWAAPAPHDVASHEDAALLTVARAVTAAALARSTSLGAHHLTAVPALIGA